MQRLLLASTTTGYQARAFRDAAARIGIPLALASDRCHVLEDPWRDGAIPIRFEPEGTTTKGHPGNAQHGIQSTAEGLSY